MTDDRIYKSNGQNKYMPIVGWLSAYEVSSLHFELVAGLIAAAVLIP